MRTSRRRTQLLAIGVVLALLIAGGLFLNRNLPGGGSRWSADSGTSVPNRFCYVLVPKDPSGTLRTVAGKSVTFDRAVLLTAAELKADIVGVIIDNSDVRVPTSELTFDLSSPRREQQIEHLRSAIAGWGQQTDWSDVSVTVQTLENGKQKIELHRTDKSARVETFRYDVTASRPTPREWWTSRRGPK